MQLKTFRINMALLMQMFTSGNIIERTEILEGIPKDAEFVGATVDRDILVIAALAPYVPGGETGNCEILCKRL